MANKCAKTTSTVTAAYMMFDDEVLLLPVGLLYVNDVAKRLKDVVSSTILKVLAIQKPGELLVILHKLFAACNTVRHNKNAFLIQYL